MEKIQINLPANPYEVLVGSNLIDNLFEFIEQRNLNKNVFAVIDENFYKIYKPQLDKIFKKYPHKFSFVIIEASEKEKSLTTLEHIFQQLIKNNFGRDTLLLSIGGGIIGDLSGFAAAAYSRGIQYVQVPTTLLSAVDSSVGGKTGVNFGETKNIIGSFYQPDFVLIDVDLLNTLPRKEVISGVGEIIKYAFLIGDEYFNFLQENFEGVFNFKEEVLRKIITDSVKYKASVVIEDEREVTGVRKMLNLGHTFGHAIEVEQKHKVKHGEAVIVGLACALFLSGKINFLSKDDLAKGIKIIESISSEIKIKTYNENKILDIMKRDKKNVNEVYKFVLLKTFGEIVINAEVNIDDVKSSLRKGVEFFN